MNEMNQENLKCCGNCLFIDHEYCSEKKKHFISCWYHDIDSKPITPSEVCEEWEFDGSSDVDRLPEPAERSGET